METGKIILIIIPIAFILVFALFKFFKKNEKDAAYGNAAGKLNKDSDNIIGAASALLSPKELIKLKTQEQDKKLTEEELKALRIKKKKEEEELSEFFTYEEKMAFLKGKHNQIGLFHKQVEMKKAQDEIFQKIVQFRHSRNIQGEVMKYYGASAFLTSMVSAQSIVKEIQQIKITQGREDFHAQKQTELAKHLNNAKSAENFYKAVSTIRPDQNAADILRQSLAAQESSKLHGLQADMMRNVQHFLRTDPHLAGILNTKRELGVVDVMQRTEYMGFLKTAAEFFSHDTNRSANMISMGLSEVDRKNVVSEIKNLFPEVAKTLNQIQNVGKGLNPNASGNGGGMMG